jgi:hypothetical protein
MLTAEASPRDVDPPKLVADLETALLALGDRRLTSTRRGRAS